MFIIRGDENEENLYKNINYGCDTYIDIRNNVFLNKKRKGYNRYY